MSKYDFKKIEKKWQKRWKEERVYEPDLTLRQAKGKKPFYNLMMFPYPSAEGLHVGNMYAFVGSDIYGRFKRMQGNDVFEPIGLDGFGIHSENYALKIGVHPMKQAKISEKRFYKQLEVIGNGFSWEEKLETYDPDYYALTQWIFIQLFKNGLAYRKKAPVNWCPSCKTVLADEQVIAGDCERCATKVIKKDLEQWFFKITKYAEKLLKNLDNLDWSEKVKIAQRNWIGKSKGASLKFSISNSQFSIKEVEVFTTRPDTINSATFLAISLEFAKKMMDNGWRVNLEIKKYIEKTLKETTKEKRIKNKTGIFTGIKAINPINLKEIPVWVVNYVLGNVGTGAIMGVPAYDERDKEFAEKFKLPIVTQPLLNKDEVVKKVGGWNETRYKLRDWLISRQRYWGVPIPMIYCEKCNWQPVPEKDLPVKLPFVEDFRPKGKGESPLASVKSFYETKCPKCGGKAKRETDVSDTFLDSAWYYIGYLLKSENLKIEVKSSIFKKLIGKWLPVDMYIGGAEHAVLHLLYSRFIAMALKDMSFFDFEEPFKVFRVHGLLIKEGAKMSKSKGNIVNPDEYIKNFGADALRMYLMFLAPFEEGGNFRDSGILGITRFLERAWKLNPVKNDQNSEKLLHKTIKKLTEDIKSLNYNTAISSLMILLNGFEKNGCGKNQYKIFLKLLAPFAPHIAEELWLNAGEKKSIHKEKWPDFDEKLIKEDIFALVIQVNGKYKATVQAETGINQKEAEKLALSEARIRDFLGDKKVKKVIFVPNRLINFVI